MALLPHARLAENPAQLGIDVAVLHLEPEDIERLLQWDGTLVRPVARGQRIEDVADRHHLRLEWDFLAPEAIRIPGPVQSLVVRPGDHGHSSKRLAPRNRIEKAIRV